MRIHSRLKNSFIRYVIRYKYWLLIGGFRCDIIYSQVQREVQNRANRNSMKIKIILKDKVQSKIVVHFDQKLSQKWPDPWHNLSAQSASNFRRIRSKTCTYPMQNLPQNLSGLDPNLILRQDQSLMLRNMALINQNITKKNEKKRKDKRSKWWEIKKNRKRIF